MKALHIHVAMTRNETTENFLKPYVIDKLMTLGFVSWKDDVYKMEPKRMFQVLEQTEAVITGWGQEAFTPQLLEVMPQLKIIAHTAGSVGAFVGPEVYDRGIRVVSGNNIFAMSVAEAVLAYIFAMYRRIPYYDNLMKAGSWRTHLDNEGLFGKRIALVGFGAIPRYLIPMLKPYECEVSAYDPYVDEIDMVGYGVKKIGLSECFVDHDIVSLHLPLTNETVGIVNGERLRSMNEGSLLINTARGRVIDEDSLIAVLNDGHIRAVLDVFSQEPLAVDSPLRSCANVILIPHMAGPTLDRRAHAAMAVIEDIVRLFNGQEPKHEISARQASHMTRPIRK